MQEYLDTILDTTEKEKIALFMADDITREAVKKVLLAGLYQNGVLKAGKPINPLLNGAMGLFFAHQGDPAVTNEMLGADLRAIAEGVSTIENGFNEMKTYVTPEVGGEEKTKNPAR